MPNYITSQPPFRYLVAHALGIELDTGTIADVLTIHNGPVLCHGLWVHVIEAVSNNACTMHFEADPTVGAANTPLCAATNIQNAALGDCFGLDGDSLVAIGHFANGTDLPCVRNDTVNMWLPPGGLDMVMQNANPTTGAGDIYLAYTPLFPGAYVSE